MAADKLIRDLSAGERVVGATYLLEEKQVRQTRNGAPYLSALLSDRSGQIQARFWNVPDGVAERLAPGQGVCVNATVTSYHDQLQLKLESIEPQEIEARDFMPSSKRSVPEMEAELRRFMRSLRDPWLGQLLERIFEGPFLALYLEAPAAKLYHHACLGGLAEHSLGVAALVDVIVPLYPQLSRDLLVVLALLHDVGKAESYSWEAGLDLSDEGQLLDHIYMGTRRVERAIEGLPAFPPELRRCLLHAMLAHHGDEAAGSPVRPKTLEAVVLHQLDMLDARIRGFEDHLARQGEGGMWSEWSKMFGARLYRGRPLSTAEGPEEGILWEEDEEEGELPF
ncbi:MAG: HD domain-containing protein [Chloroflexia bacterium]|nr:HD domain-containing protein [Chloroflexia bacterium]